MTPSLQCFLLLLTLAFNTSAKIIVYDNRNLQHPNPLQTSHNYHPNHSNHKAYDSIGMGPIGLRILDNSSSIGRNLKQQQAKPTHKAYDSIGMGPIGLRILDNYTLSNRNLGQQSVDNKHYAYDSIGMGPVGL